MAQKLDSVKRFGPRYGSKLKQRLAKIEKLHSGKHKCPFCLYDKLVRVHTGIWQCEKCNAKFAGKAYVPYKKTRRQVKVEDNIAKPEEEQEEDDDEEYEVYKDNVPEKLEDQEEQND